MYSQSCVEHIKPVSKSDSIGCAYVDILTSNDATNFNMFKALRGQVAACITKNVSVVLYYNNIFISTSRRDGTSGRRHIVVSFNLRMSQSYSAKVHSRSTSRVHGITCRTLTTRRPNLFGCLTENLNIIFWTPTSTWFYQVVPELVRSLVTMLIRQSKYGIEAGDFLMN